jgi:predicted RNase H-like HicB family nuclease
MMRVLSWFGGLGWQIKAGMIAALCVASFIAGWRVNVWKNAYSQGRSIAKAEKTAQTSIVKVEKVEGTKQTKLGDTKIVYRTIREKINDENDQRICFADNNALQLWNASIAGADKPASEQLREASTTGATDTEGAEVVATVEQVLTNASENFQICNENAIKHNALIDTLEVYKGKMCVCAE